MHENNCIVVLKQEMAVNSTQQIEEELRRALKLNHDQPAFNSRQARGSSCVSAVTSLSSGDVRCVGSLQVTSSPQNAVSSPSHADTAEKIPAASLSSPSVTNSTQASSVSGAGAGRRRKPRRSKHNSPRDMPPDVVNVTHSTVVGKNISPSQKSAVAAKSGSPRIDTAAMTTPASVGNASASSAVSAGLTTSGSTPSTVAGMNSSSNVRAAATVTVTNQQGGKASRGRGITKHVGVSAVPSQTDQTDGTVKASRGCGTKKQIGASTVPGQPPLQKPVNEEHTHDVSKCHVALSGQLYTDSNINVKSAPLPTADKNATDLSNEAATKVVQNSVKLPAKEHEKGGVLCSH